MNLVTQKVIVKYQDKKKSYDEVVIRHLSTKSRFNRSIKTLATLWLIALGCIFIPIFHFVLVPFFSILGIAMFFRSFRVESILIPGQCKCPQCEEEFELEEAQAKWPISQICKKCCHSLLIFVHQS